MVAEILGLIRLGSEDSPATDRGKCFSTRNRLADNPCFHFDNVWCRNQYDRQHMALLPRVGNSAAERFHVDLARWMTSEIEFAHSKKLPGP
jgi:hypothetical protein